MSDPLFHSLNRGFFFFHSNKCVGNLLTVSEKKNLRRESPIYSREMIFLDLTRWVFSNRRILEVTILNGEGREEGRRNNLNILETETGLVYFETV